MVVQRPSLCWRNGETATQRNVPALLACLYQLQLCPLTQVKRAKLLDSKRSQNVGILISSQHLEIADIESAVLNLDTSDLSLDQLEQLLEMVSRPALCYI